MGILWETMFGTSPKRKIAKELKDIEDIIKSDKYNASQLTKIREWLISINTRINNNSLQLTSENVDKINKIKSILGRIELQELKASDEIKNIENIMFSLK